MVTSDILGRRISEARDAVVGHTKGSGLEAQRSQSAPQFEKTDPTFIINCPCCHHQLTLTLPMTVHVEVTPAPLETEDRARGGSAQVDLMALPHNPPELLDTALNSGWRVVVTRRGMNQDARQNRFARYEAKFSKYTKIILCAVFLLFLWVLIKLTGLTKKLEMPEKNSSWVRSAPTDTMWKHLQDTSSNLSVVARENLKNFLTAGDMEGKLAHVNNPDAVRSLLSLSNAEALNFDDIRIEQFLTAPGVLSSKDIMDGVQCLAWHKNRVAFPSIGSIEPASFDSSAPLIFFKHGKVDWFLFDQHRGGSLVKFVNQPSANATEFRVVLVRLSDPEAQEVKLMLSDVCLDLQELAQLTFPRTHPDARPFLEGMETGKPRTATVELRWETSSPARLGCPRLICWNFKGIQDE